MDPAAAPRKRFDVVAYLKLFRFPLVFTAIADSAAGYILSSFYVIQRSWTGGLLGLGKLALVSAGLYLFGMSMNDIADRNKDRELAPSKVIPSGRLSLRGAWIGSLSALAVSFVALMVLPSQPTVAQIVVWFLTVGAILCYDLGIVKVSPMMGLVRALNLTLGLTGSLGWRFWELALVAAPLFVYVTALTQVSTLEDREVNRKGLAWGVGFMAVGALLAACLIPVVRMLSTGWRVGWHSELAALATGWVLVAWLARRAWMARDKKGVMLLVRDGVAGIILVDAALVMSAGRLQAGFFLLSLLLPAALSVALFKRLA